MDGPHRLLLSAPAKFAARRLADVSPVALSPEVVHLTTRIRAWVLGADRIHILDRQEPLIGAMGSFPSPAALRLMSAVMGRLPIQMKQWVAEDSRLRTRVSYINRCLFVNYAYDADRVSRINDTARQFIDLYGVRDE